MIYLELFWVFLKIGLFSFGGGYGMIPVMKQEVLAKGWLTEDAFFDIVGISESTPGPIAVNLATIVGANIGGFFGSLLATLGAVLPAFLIMFFVMKALEKFSQNKYVSAFLDGVKPVVVGFIIAVGVTLLVKIIGVSFDFGEISLNFDIKAMIISAITVIILLASRFLKKKVPPALLILFTALLGMIVYSFM